MSASEWIFEVNEDEFQAKVVDKSVDLPVVVDFWAPWCGPCRMLAPILEILVSERGGKVLLAKVNIDENQRLAMEFGIQSIPAVIAFRGGSPILDFLGVLPEQQIRRFLDQIMPSEAETEAKEAAALESSDLDKAEQMYRDALSKDHNQDDALLGLSRVLISKGQLDEALEVLENLGDSGEKGEEAEKHRAEIWLKKTCATLGDEAALKAQVDADPKNAQARYELGCLRAEAGQFEEALKLLLNAGELDHNLATSKVREAMVKVFAIVGIHDPLADNYRSQLSSLLY